MYYELALISVLIAAGYWGLFFVRRDATRTYGIMQLAAAALAGLGLYGRKTDAGMGFEGAIGVGAGACLLIVGPVIRSLARRMVGAERFGIAEKLLSIAEVLAPGSGIADEKALLGAMREIRDGNIEHAVQALTAAKDRAPAEARLAIDERIAMLYLAAYRWDDAIAHAEQNLFGVVPPASDADESPRALRKALGIAPPVWVELLGAYGYKGDLDQAARMLSRLEDVCAGREDAAIWVHRGRMMFLALAGRVAAVETLVEPRRSRHMSRAARTYWMAVAHERKGDGPAAEAAYTKARARSRGRPRVSIDQALARLSAIEPTAEPRSLDLGPAASELVARVETAAPPNVAIANQPRGPWATRLLAAGVLGSAAVIAITLGESSDIGVLIRAGAMVRGFIHDGEWWRLVSCVFVHIGGLHLLVNVIGLWFLGRLCEDLFGPARTIAIFAMTSLGGVAASYLASAAGITAGASGAIFGMIGAVFVEVTWHRRRHRVAWNRGMWGSLAIVTIGQLAIDFLYSGITEQWSHVGGLLVGLAMGAALSPYAPWHWIGRVAARVIALAFGVVCAVAAVMVARTSVADSLARPAPAHFTIVRPAGVVAMTAPGTWQVSTDELHDPDDIINLMVDRGSGPLAVELEQRVRDEQQRARKEPPHFDQIDVATQRLVALPQGWTGSELVVSVEAIGGRERYRVVVAGTTVAGGGTVMISLYVPETVARDASDVFRNIIASIAVQ